jgi:4-diphosphocytidyl-2-C-methyl-D-erythritol kinase
VPTLTAPAKLTLSLRITGVRPDGYHLIDAEMVTVDLPDLVTIGGHGALPGATRVVVDGVTGGLEVPEGEGNLVARALALAGRWAEVGIVKRIPAGAGLGGGSADAAAVLRWAGVTDPAVTVGVGADVPFCVLGGRARVRGIGEEVDPLPHEARTLTLLTPPVGCPTPLVYRAWDDLGGPTADGPNDLEAAALAVAPDLVRWRDELGDATGVAPVLAGSGSTWFVEGDHPGTGRVVVRTVPEGWVAPDADA